MIDSYEMSKFKPDVKHILDCINNLTPWDKTDLIANLLTEAEYNGEIENYLQAMGYVDYDDIDFVEEVKKNDLGSEVLEDMSDWEIGNYVSCHPDIINEIDIDDMVEAIYDNDNIEECLDLISGKYSEEFEKWLNKIKFEKKTTYKVTKK